MVGETIDFDRAVGKAPRFCRKDGNTLVVITADHETGGIAIHGGDYDKKEVTVKYTTVDIRLPCPVFLLRTWC